MRLPPLPTWSALAVCALVAPPARGQTAAAEGAPPAPPETSAAPPAAPVDDSAALDLFALEEELVVTGSRLPRKDLNTPAPVTLISREEIEHSGRLTLGDFLQTLVFQGGSDSLNSATNNDGDGSTRIDLRGLGANRTLVLLNGRRIVGIDATGQVDLNVIPLAVVERIEVLLDGASGIYGSDAIAGVVNIITRRNYEGTELSAQTGLSQHGDAWTKDFRATTGVTGDKGSLLFSAGFFDQQPVMAGSRSFTALPLLHDYVAGTTSPFGSTDIPAGRFTLPTDPNSGACLPGGSATYQALCRDYPGQTNFVTDPTAKDGFRPFAPTDYYNYQAENYNLTPLQRFTLFSSGDARLGGGVRGYFEGLLVNRQSSQQLAPEPLDLASSGLTLSGNSLYNPLGLDITDLGRRLNEFGDRVTSQDLTTFRIVTGVDGTIPAFHDLSWDLSLNYGRTQGAVQSTGALISSQIQQALGPSMLVNGVPTCVRTPGDPTTAIPGCTPLNLLGGAGTLGAAQAAGLVYTGVSRTVQQETALQLNLNDELFRLWSSRKVALAVGYEYRREYAINTPDPIAAANNSTDLNYAATQGGFYVNELYAELSIPIAENRPGIDQLEAVASVRWSDYSTFGTTTNYKLGGRWSPVRELALRGTWSTGFRAPNLSDLYLGQTQNFPSVVDPCANLQGANPTLVANCRAAGVPINGSGDTRSQQTSINGGNVNLQAETSKAFTLGAVLQPRFLRNLSLTADYYNFRVYDSITNLGAGEILSGCYTGSNPGYCGQVQRDGQGLITQITDLSTNVGEDATSGFDFAVRWSEPTAVGKFSAQLDANWLLAFDRTLADGTVIRAAGTYDLLAVYPRWRFNAGVGWDLAGLAVGATTRVVAGFNECGDSSGVSGNDGFCYQQAQNAALLGIPQSALVHQVSAYAVADAFVSYGFQSGIGKTSVLFGCNNLFDTAPPTIFNSFTPNSDPVTYDFVGRYFYLKLQQNL